MVLWKSLKNINNRVNGFFCFRIILRSGFVCRVFGTYNEPKTFYCVQCRLVWDVVILLLPGVVGVFQKETIQIRRQVRCRVYTSRATKGRLDF